PEIHATHHLQPFFRHFKFIRSNRVYVAYDRRSNSSGGRRDGGGSWEDTMTNGNRNKNKETCNDGWYRNEGNAFSSGNRRDSSKKCGGGSESHVFLLKLSVLCKEQGLEKAEVKLLGRLEFMVVLDSERTVSNVLNDAEHGIRR
ncbi:hypothetical protein Tco_1046800, partial [Tanacetum coccineum]